MSSESSSIKLLWQRDLGIEYTKEQWLDLLSKGGKYVKEARNKFIQYKVLNRYYHTPTRLHRMKLMADNSCWKCKNEVGTYLHCFWECSLVLVFGLKSWTFWVHGLVQRSPRLQNCVYWETDLQCWTSQKESIVVVGLVTACRIILRHWKTTKCPRVVD